MGRNLGENIRPSIESIAKKVDEKRARMLDPDPFSGNSSSFQHCIMLLVVLHEPVLNKSPQQHSTPTRFCNCKTITFF
jgi:hypothetical protein